MALWPTLSTWPMVTRVFAKESYEVFCDGGVARLDNFVSLSWRAAAKVEKFKGASTKGHRREMELTIEAMRTGAGAPIPLPS